MDRDSHKTQLEAEHWDRINERRTSGGYIPFEADIRRATRAERPNGQDPEMTRIVVGKYRDIFIDRVAHVPGGQVLDICCGPGWLALELGRRGQKVDAYDLSSKAIALAKRMLDENPFREGFGTVNYQVQDVTALDLGVERFDAVCGWSAFHHIQDLPEFLGRVFRALKPGGIIATMDDLPTGRIERYLGWFIMGLMPTSNLTYRQKLLGVLKRVNRAIHKHGAKVASPQAEPVRSASPAEAECTHEIEPLFCEKFKVRENFRYNAFAVSACYALKGSDRVRYRLARILTWLDRFLCRAGVVKGGYRIIIAQKPI